MEISHRVYLGDSVYAGVNAFGGVVLTTENGFGPTNTIVLDPGVIEAFDLWRARLRSIVVDDAVVREKSP